MGIEEPADEVVFSLDHFHVLYDVQVGILFELCLELVSHALHGRQDDGVCLRFVHDQPIFAFDKGQGIAGVVVVAGLLA